MKPRVVWIATHPIQYQVPVFRVLAASSEIDFRVAFLTKHGMEPTFDPEFGQKVQWDTPLLDGYSWELVGSAPKSMAEVSKRDVVRFVSALKADLIIVPGYSAPPLLTAIATARLKGICCAILSDSTPQSGSQSLAVRTLKRQGLRPLLHNQRALVPGSLARDAMSDLGIRPSHIHSYPHCVDMTRLDNDFAQRQELRSEARASLGWSTEDVGFLFVGKLIELKQPMAIVNAFAELGTGKLALIGSGPLESGLRTQCQDISGVSVLGFQNQTLLPRYYAAADVLVLYSTTETWGLVVNEAMAMGCAVIASSAVGCVPDLVDGKQTGWVVDPTRPTTLANAMRDASQQPASLRKMGLSAHALIQAYRPEHAAAGVIDAAYAACQAEATRPCT